MHTQIEVLPAGVTQEQYDRQVALEQSCLERGINTYRRQQTAARSAKRESQTDYGNTLLRKTVAPVSEGLSLWLDEARSRPGKNHTAVAYLEKLDTDVSALLACRTIIDALCEARAMQDLAIRIGRRIEEEVRFTQMEQTHKALFHKVTGRLDSGPFKADVAHRRTVLIHTANKFDVPWDPWPTRVRFMVGLVLLDLFIQKTGFLEIVQRQSKRKVGFVKAIQPTEELLEYLYDYTGIREVLFPERWPMISRPLPWSSTSGGGYYTPRLRRPLVWSRTRGYLEELKASNPQRVYDAVNYLQDTKWKINARVLDAVQACKEAGLEVKSLQFREAEIPPRPAGYRHDVPQAERWANVHPDVKTEWKLKAAATLRSNLKKRGRMYSAIKALTVAELLRDEPVIYMPYGLDFRGRVYAGCPALHPQGTDLSKALLTFAHGARLGERGVWWLAVQLANTFGYDKASMDDRVQWAYDNSEKILASANDPVSEGWWRTADKPWQFLAACFEWQGFVTHGPEYVCNLRIDVDGSCNGLQVLSAAARDERTGSLVNLVPTPTPSDIYARVAERLAAKIADPQVIRALEERDERAIARWSEKGSRPDKKPRILPHTQLAREWLEWGITRKYVTKRCVMVMPYGGTQQAFMKYILAGIQEREKDSEEDGTPEYAPFEKPHVAASWLTPLLWETISEEIPGPRKLMDWFQEVAKIVSAECMPVTWRTPTGFLTQQVYNKTEENRVKSKVGDQVIKLTIREETSEINQRKMAQSIAPNWTHSYDAACMIETMLISQALGIPCFAAVHDSYGTLPSHMDTLSAAVRAAYIKIFSRNVLADFIEDVKHILPEDVQLPEPPPFGNLDIRLIQDSIYFFA